MKPNKPKRKSTLIKIHTIINAATEYKRNNPDGQYPERMKLAIITGIAEPTVSNILREIKRDTGQVYCREVSPKEKGKRIKQSLLGNGDQIEYS